MKNTYSLQPEDIRPDPLQSFPKRPPDLEAIERLKADPFYDLLARDAAKRVVKKEKAKRSIFSRAKRSKPNGHTSTPGFSL